MSGFTNFDRQYRLIIGKSNNNADEIGETNEKQPVPLHISFNCEKSDKEAKNTGKISIWNLSPEHEAVLNDKDCNISLRAGYGKNLALMFAGTVSFASTVQDGADRKTSIEVVDSLVPLRDTYVSLNYKGKVNWKQILDETAAQLGIAVVYSYNATFVEVNNFSYVGMGKNVLSKGCSCCGLEWNIQNGILHIKKPGGVMSRECYVLNPKTGLLGSPTRVIVEEDKNAGTKTLGWDIEYFMNGAIGVDDYVKLESDMAEGFFRVKSVRIEGDNINGDWICNARLLEVTL